MGWSHHQRRSIYGNTVISFTVLLIPTDTSTSGGAKPIISLWGVSKVSSTGSQWEQSDCKSDLNAAAREGEDGEKGGSSSPRSERAPHTPADSEQAAAFPATSRHGAVVTRLELPVGIYTADGFSVWRTASSLIWGGINLAQRYKERLLDSRWSVCNCNTYLLMSYLKPVVTWEKFSSPRPAVVKWNGLHVHHRHVNLCKASVMTWRFR